MNDTTSDHQFTAFLGRVSIEEARLDYAPTTQIEIRMLGRTK